jgi:hypothetical protein
VRLVAALFAAEVLLAVVPGARRRAGTVFGRKLFVLAQALIG